MPRRKRAATISYAACTLFHPDCTVGAGFATLQLTGLMPPGLAAWRLAGLPASLSAGSPPVGN